MQMRALPGWVEPLATVFLALAVLTAVGVAVDLFVRGYQQRSRGMDAVWILSALWLGPFAVPLYARTGRPRSRKWQEEHRAAVSASLPVEATRVGLAGGAASLVGHVLGVPLVLAAGWTLFGVDMFAMIAVIAVLAVAMLGVFEYLTAARRGAGRTTLVAAFVAATITVLAFDVGMGGWMLVLHFNELMPPLASVNFVFLMQIGIALGFLTGFPVVALLLKRGAAAAVGTRTATA